MYTEHDAAVLIAPAVTVTDPDGPGFSGGSLRVDITNATGDDVLAVRPDSSGADQVEVVGNQVLVGGVVVGSVSGGTAGSALDVSFSSGVSLNDVQVVLRSIAYANTSDAPSSDSRQVHFTLTDAGGASADATATIAIVPVNDPAVVTLSPSAGHVFVENGAPVSIDPALVLSDPDGSHLVGAIVTIGNGEHPGDMLRTDTSGTSIVANFDAASGTLTLSGDASLLDYQQVLRTVTYEDASDTPDTSPRTISIQLDDGSGAGPASEQTVEVVATNDAPVVIAGGTLLVTENDAARPVAPSLHLGDVDSTMLSGATVTIDQGFTSGEDVLSFTSGAPGITGHFDASSGVLTLSGTASVADYESVLRTVAYTDTSDAPHTDARTISFQVTDADGATSTTGPDSATVVTVTAVDDPSTLDVPHGLFAATASVPLAIPGLSIDDVDGGNVSVTIASSLGAKLAASVQGGAGVVATAGGLTITGTTSQVADALHTLTYTANSGPVGTDTLTVTPSFGPAQQLQVQVAQHVFYIDNADATPDTGNNVGTLANPFNSIKAFEDAHVDGVNDLIVIRGGTYTEAQNNTAAQVLALHDGEAVIGDTSRGSAPVIQVSVAGHAGVLLAQNNSISNVTIQMTNASQTGILSGGSSGTTPAGHLALDDVSIGGPQTSGTGAQVLGSGSAIHVNGGTISMQGGAISNVSGDAIVMNGGSISLDGVTIQNIGGAALNATGLVGDNQITNTTITGFGLATLSGSNVSIANTSDAIHVVNNSTDLGSLTLWNDTISGGASGNNGVFVKAQGTSDMKLDVLDSLFTGIYGNAVDMRADLGASGTLQTNILGNTFDNAAPNGNGGIDLTALGTVKLLALVNGNTMSDLMRPLSTLGAVTIGNSGAADAEVSVTHNTISSIAGGRGITASATGGTSDLLIQGNQIDGLGSASASAIWVNFQKAGQGDQTATGNVIVADNVIGGNSPDGLWTSGAQAQGNGIVLLTQGGTSMTAAITGNSVYANTQFEAVRVRAIDSSTVGVAVSDNLIRNNTASGFELDATTGNNNPSGAAINMDVSGNDLSASGVLHLLTKVGGTINLVQSASALAGENVGIVNASGTGVIHYGASEPASPTHPTLPDAPDAQIVAALIGVVENPGT